MQISIHAGKRMKQRLGLKKAEFNEHLALVRSMGVSSNDPDLPNFVKLELQGYAERKKSVTEVLAFQGFLYVIAENNFLVSVIPMRPEFLTMLRQKILPHNQ